MLFPICTEKLFVEWYEIATSSSADPRREPIATPCENCNYRHRIDQFPNTLHLHLLLDDSWIWPNLTPELLC